MSAGTEIAPFEDRVAELDALGRILIDGAAGRPAAVVHGEAGIGKSELVAHFVRERAYPRESVMWGSCATGSTAQPFGAWIDALRPHAESGERRTEAEQLLALLGGRGPVASEPAAAPVSRNAALLALFEATTDLIASLPGQPIVVLDDAESADSGTLDLLVHVARLALLPHLVVIFRGERLPLQSRLAQRLAELHRIRGCEYLQLGALAPDAARALVTDLSGGRLNDRAVDRICAEAAGNPFFLTELAREAGRHGDPSRADAPQTIIAAIALRLAALDGQTRDLLDLAAVLEDPIPTEALEVASGLGPEELDEVLRRAEDAGVLRARGSDHYEFQHALVRQALYEQMSGWRRAVLHRQAAERIIAAPGSREIVAPAEIARHYHASRRLPGAEHGVPHALAAAGDAAATGASESEAEMLAWALAMLGDSDRRLEVDILGSLAVAQAHARMPGLAEATLERALDACDRLSVDPSVPAGLTCRVQAAVTTNFGYPRPDLARRALAALGPQETGLRARLTLLSRGESADASGPLRIVRRPMVDPHTLAIVRAEAPEFEQATAIMTLSPWTLPELEAEFARAVVMADPVARLVALIAIAGRAAMTSTPLALANEIVAEVESLSERLGSRWGSPIAMNYRAMLIARAGGLEDAAALISAVSTEARPRPRGPFSSYAEYVLAVINRHRAPDWEATVATSWEIARETRPIQYFALSLAAVTALGLAHLNRGPDARRILTHVITLLDRSVAAEGYADAALGLGADAVAVLGDRALAAQLLPIAQRLIAGGAGNTFMTQSDLTLGRLHATLDQRAAATAAFDRARAALDAAGDRPLRAIADFEQSRVDEARSGELREAAGLSFDALGMETWSARLRASGPAGRRRPGGLTSREQEVLGLVASGLSNREIAERLVLSVHTVERHVNNVYAKIGVRNRAGAVAYAIHHRIVT